MSSKRKFGREELANGISYLVDSVQVHSAGNHRCYAIFRDVWASDEVKVAGAEEKCHWKKFVIVIGRTS